MTSATISAANIDYLQRTGMRPDGRVDGASSSAVPVELRRLWRVESVGLVEKKPESRQEEARPRLPTEDLLTGVYGERIPLAFVVRGAPNGVAFHLGTWIAAGAGRLPSVMLEQGQELLRSGLASLYPAVTVSAADVDFSDLSQAGLALGIPTAKRPDPADGALALDRLIRALSGTSWASVVLAEPVHESVIADLRHGVIEELRSAQAGALAATAPAPLLEHYTELLRVSLQHLLAGLTGGAWRVGVYLLGEETSYQRLTSLWRGVFSGDESLPEPVQVWDLEAAGEFAREWALPDEPGPPGPGNYRHPLLFQTLLTSRQLAAYVHFPRLETSGFGVTTVPDFDAIPPRATGDGTIELGEVVVRGQPTQNEYSIRIADLVRHTFVAGVTGAGKTNTIFRLLEQASAAAVPFLVVEPAKSEYRALCNVPALTDGFQVFTLGDERVSPFRLNPFEVLAGTPVAVHLDLLRSVFAVSFGMWTPLPQILEQCLYGIYADRGWDITADANARLDGAADRSEAFPTLSDLATKVEDVTRELGYEDRITSDMRAALLTRINSLRVGGKGRMLDVPRSLPMRALLDRPTVLELDGMGDDDDKAFVMGLLFIRLVEHRRTESQTREGLRHLLVIEEAHRLLSNVGTRAREEEADARGKAVETFANLLAEIRAYGQGIVVADQVPVKLAPDVLKNTNLKLAHRVVAADDRAALAGAMAMDERQAHALATLRRGQAAVFSEGDDAPVLVNVPLVKDIISDSRPDDAELALQMSSARAAETDGSLLRPFQPAPDVLVEDARAWDAARELVDDPQFQRTFARIALSSIEDGDALDRLWPDLVVLVRSRAVAGVDEDELLLCLIARAAEWFALRRGAQGGWPYSATRTLADRLREVLVGKAAGTSPAPSLKSFRELALQLHVRPFDPYPACSRICRELPPRCLYRAAAADLIAAGDMDQAWEAARAADLALADDGAAESWQVCMDGGDALIEFANDDRPAEQLEAADAAARRASLCFGQQLIMRDLASPERSRTWIDKLLKESGHE